MHIPRYMTFATALLALGHVSAGPVSAAGSVEGNNPPALSGRWTVTALHGKKTDTPAGDITFEPADGSISGATACNFFKGAFQTPPRALTINVAMMTRRACIGGAAEHERSFLEAMKATATYRIDTDRLTLAATDGATLAELVRTPDATLEGQRHKIVSYLKNDGLYSIRAETGTMITLKDGRIEGFTGCRPFSASYTLKGDTLSISALAPAQTLAPCDENVRDQDQAILAGLPDVTTYDTSRNLIRLLKEQGGAAVLWITPQLP